MIDWVTGLPGKIILAALAAYLLWHLVNAWRLYFWFKDPDRHKPSSLGAWAHIFRRVGKMRRRNMKLKTQLRSMTDEFQRVTDAYPDATLIVDKKSRLTWLNQAAGNLFGLSRNNDTGRPVKTLLNSTDFTGWLATQGEINSKLRMRAPGKDNIWLEVSSVSIAEDQRLIIFRDVSEIHNIERIRKDFVTNVSHELRTPLTVMRGYLELLKDRPPDEITSAVERMHTQAMQMQSMLDDLLELSRLQAVDAPGDDAHVSVAAMLVQLQEQAEEISRGDHKLVFDVDAGLGLHGIKADLESAFRNLIVNALKYTPEGGTVSIIWQDSDEGPKLTVADTGIGIPKGEIPRLTERFYRVSSDRGRKSGGTGLGLAIVKHALHEHQARLVIDSEYGVGSQFTCIFPPTRRRS